MRGISVKAAAKLSGLSPHTLRAWERRYLVVDPARSASGRRGYSTADIDKLKLLHTLTLQGHAISSLAPLSMDELRSLAGERPEGKTSNLEFLIRSNSEETASNYLIALLEALKSFKLDAINTSLLKARINMPLRSFVLDVVSPLLATVGLHVAEGRLEISQEHALSAILRSHLGEVLTQVQKTGAEDKDAKTNLPNMLFSTPEGDLHEFGILLSAILAGVHGYRVLYLGPNMPITSLVNAARIFEASILIVGSVDADEDRLPQSLSHYVSGVSAGLIENNLLGVEIWIGGRCDFALEKKSLPTGILHLPTLKDFENKIMAIKESLK